MTIFIEDYYKKYGNYLSFNDETFEQIKNARYRNGSRLTHYHPIEIINRYWLFSDPRNQDFTQVAYRLSGERVTRYREMIELDYNLQLYLYAKNPDYLKFFTKYNSLKEFSAGFFSIWFADLIFACMSLYHLCLSLKNLIMASINAVNTTPDVVNDNLITASYHFCISLMCALHSIIAPLLTTISFITRTAASIHALCTDNEDRRQPNFSR